MIKEQKQQVYKIKNNIYHCGTSIAMKYIGGKWKSIIIWYLRNGTLRFSEIKKLMPDITEKMLSIQLKSLLEDELVIRKVYGKKPPLRTQYSLTKFGESLIPVIDIITQWGINLGETKGELIEIE